MDDLLYCRSSSSFFGLILLPFFVCRLSLVPVPTRTRDDTRHEGSARAGAGSRCEMMNDKPQKSNP
jgi:hypothetical protein